MTNGLPLATSTWGAEEITALHEVIDSGQFTMGRRVRSFEEDLAAFHAVPTAVMSNSGSSANLLMLSACRYGEGAFLEPGDEVIVPAVSWGTTYYPINQVGAKIRLVDVDAETLNITTEAVAEAIGPRTKAVLAVNLLGNPAPLDELQRLCAAEGLVLLEDNCESLGATLGGQLTGTFGSMGSLSFFFSHHMATMEGGATLVRDERFANSLLMLRAHGWTRDVPGSNSPDGDPVSRWSSAFDFALPGYNLRPIEMEAAVGSEQLRKLPDFLAARRANAAVWQEVMSEVEGVRIQREFGSSSWFGFSVVLEGGLRGKRDLVVDGLQSIGVESRPVVAGNVMRHPVSHLLDFSVVPDLPVADEVHSQGLFIGNHHYSVDSALESVAQFLRSVR